MPSPVVVCKDFRNEFETKQINIDGFSLQVGSAILDENLFNNNTKEKILDQYPNHVLIRKLAFSCNYRDKAILVRASKTPKLKCLPFGSDFVAEVIAIGKNVKSLQINDKVIPDGNYPTSSDNSTVGLPTNFASMEHQYFNENKLMKIRNEMPNDVAAAFTVGGQTTYGILDKLKINENINANMLIWSITSNTSLFLMEALRKYPNINVYGTSTKNTFNEKLFEKGVKKIFTTSLDNSHELINEILKSVDSFDYIFDPFADLHLLESIKYLGVGGKYITCGIANQTNGITYNKSVNNEMSLKAYTDIIMKNIQILGNCLGTTQDLSNALDDYYNNKFSINIDSVYNVDNIVGFLHKTYLDQNRFGKVVYEF